MDATDIKVLLKVGERISFDCKKAENNIPKSVWETYSSFANTIGGIIVLGITENI
ncbi:MAG: helix-turn-helix domain-containing protein, partial [Capnocytophaga gingivalis]